MTSWKNDPPTLKEVTDVVEYYFIRGGGFNYDISVCVNSGVNSALVDGKRQFFADLNFQIFADGFHSLHIWRKDLNNYGPLIGVKWYGPIKLPKD